MAQWFRQSLVKMINKEIDFDSDSIVLSLHTSSYTPDLNAHDYVNDLSAELAASGGYSTGGVTLGSKTVTYTAADSWGTSRANSTAYTVGQIVRPATGNGFLYRCVVAGTSAASPPSFTSPTPVVGANIADGAGALVWDTIGSGIIVLDAADPSWAAATFTGVRYGVISDRTPGTAATQPLLGLIDFVTDQAGGGGAFTIQLDAQGILQLLIP